MSDHKSKKPMTASDYIKNQPHLQGKPLTIQNNFSALAEYPPLSYSKAVADTSASSSNPTQTPPEKSVYFLKPQKQHLFTTQFFKPIKLRELQSFTNRIFYQDSLYPTDNIIKNRTFYEYILVDSKSAEIAHYPDKNDPNQTAYSTCKIKQVYTPQDLGFINLHTAKSFSTPGFHIQGYTYVDYQNALLRTLYLRPFDHSWFLSFDSNCPKKFPGWFFEWWYWFGPTEQIYPQDITKTFFPFYQRHLPKDSTNLYTKIAFHIDMGIPWICSWHFNLIQNLTDIPEMPYSLVKEYRIKWWDKYNLDRCSLSNISKFFHILNQTQTAVKSISKSIPLLTPSQLIKQFGSDPQKSTPKPTQPTPTNTPTKQPSPTHSTGSSTSNSHKSKHKSNKLKKLLADIVHQLDSSDDEEEDIIRLVTQPSQDNQDPFGGPLAQDPFEL